jgi:valyl-tRNA synthetase
MAFSLHEGCRFKMEKGYEHKGIEDSIYNFWKKNNFFHSEPDFSKKKFVIMMPPPNITGKLHIGHALTFTLQDIFVRFHRMLGEETLWFPGMDHAGIATQAVVERELLKRGIRKEEIGREKFVEEVWAWKEQYGNTILNQLKKLGVSPDWTKLRFTLDKSYADAVVEAFVKYYNDGLLYRGERIINWCPRCHTAISDIEVDYITTKSKLYYIKYPLKEDPQEFITVATTRPETMLGDTAVVVNPEDERYKDFVGKTAILPLVQREIPIIADSVIDMHFGTGAVKVTPAHSSIDFEIAQKHNLVILNVINDRAEMVNVPQKYAGLTTEQCREQVVKDLREASLIIKEEDYENSLGHCQRCGTVVESIISKQWFLKMEPLAKMGIASVENGDIKLTPDKWVKVYFDWLKNIKDWCISRQLWWGHRIPAYYCDNCGETTVSKIPPDKCPKCDSKNIRQDEDVLDTWFSSALWPFATLGWPKKTEELEYYYPTSLLITGYDIIFFWVARMIMSGLYFMGMKPFSEVMLHGLVRDQSGRKMSKSLKNIVDPLNLIDEYGADALRFTLSYLSTVGGQDVNLSQEKLVASRNFVNKVWNASRFVITNLEDFNPFQFDEKELILEIEDKWILSRLNKMIVREIELLNDYDPGQVSRELYDFVWGEFCDWYIELAKVRLKGTDQSKRKTVQYVLWDSLMKILKLLQPFIPFVTEKIYSNFPHKEKALIISQFPQITKSLVDEQIEKEADFVFSIIRALRSLKAEFNIGIIQEIECFYFTLDKSEKILITREDLKIRKIAGLSCLRYLEKRPEKGVKTVVSGTTLYLKLPFEIDVSKEIEKFKNKLNDLDKKIFKISERLNNQNYLKKADAEIIKKDREELKNLEKLKNTILSHLEDLKEDG